MKKSNILMYTTEDGVTKMEATFDDDTVWLSIDQMSELFQRDKKEKLLIIRHWKKHKWNLKNIKINRRILSL